MQASFVIATSRSLLLLCPICLFLNAKWWSGSASPPCGQTNYCKKFKVYAWTERTVRILFSSVGSKSTLSSPECPKSSMSGRRLLMSLYLHFMLLLIFLYFILHDMDSSVIWKISTRVCPSSFTIPVWIPSQSTPTLLFSMYSARTVCIHYSDDEMYVMRTVCIPKHTRKKQSILWLLHWQDFSLMHTAF